jgi:hypothetical protein
MLRAKVRGGMDAVRVFGGGGGGPMKSRWCAAQWSGGCFPAPASLYHIASVFGMRAGARAVDVPPVGWMACGG